MKTDMRVRARALLVAAALGGMTAVLSGPVYADAVLDNAQVSAIQNSLSAALEAAHGDRTAIEAAISQALESAIVQYGPDATASITSAILTIAEQDGATAGEIGVALADAAASEATTSASVASTIASTLANEGKSEEIAAFESTANSLGYSNLASIAGSGATPTGELGGGLTSGGGLGNAFSGGFNGGGGGGGGGGCLNPSCTQI